MRLGRLNPRNRRIRNRLYIWDFFKKNPCTSCGQSNPIFLMLIDKENKKYRTDEICNLASKEMKSEMQRCKVICFNCHIYR